MAAAKWPLNEVGAALQRRQVQRLSAVFSMLLRSHAQRLVTGGWKASLPTPLIREGVTCCWLRLALLA